MPSHKVHHLSDGISPFCDKYCTCKSIYHRISWQGQKTFLSIMSSYSLGSQKLLEYWINTPPLKPATKIWHILENVEMYGRDLLYFCPRTYITGQRTNFMWDSKCILIARAGKTFLTKKYFTENVIYNKLMLFPGKNLNQPTGSSRKRGIFSRNTNPLIQGWELQDL